ncbi:hypothetical protein KFK09_019555 [Dendrobium nobile]|uniref:Reverse transcriptase zinc-binding domain-containing protein n=1 Tax=Dendrobium nobile TaxID=94219 RepID=A0A8T3AX14_DENNO|nr:hypothetical protein KFK09_019555 [Dendrobium nobile]
MFNASKDGKFSLKNAWNVFRIKGDYQNIFNIIWHKNIPTTISIFVWRALHKFLPTDDNMIYKGLSLASKCQCCVHTENIHHVLISGPVAVRTWAYFDDLFRLNCFNYHLPLKVFLNCWLIKVKGHIRNVIPCLILWFLWLERNNSIFNNVKMNHLNVIQNVKDKVAALWAVNLLYNKDFENYSQVCEHFGIPMAISIPLMRSYKWIKPPYNFYKLNIDVSFKSNVSGFGGVIRDSNGCFVAACAGPLFNVDYQKAICMAILFGCQLCNSINIVNLVIEVSDSVNLSMFSMEEDGCCNANCFYLIREIKQCMLGLNYSFMHSMNGRNDCAIWLASLGCDLTENKDFVWANCPKQLKGYLILEEREVPYVLY